MKRHYYISDNLDDLEVLEGELEANGISTPQIHVLSEHDADVENHHLNEVEAVLKKDVVHSMEVGSIIGLLGAASVLLVAYFTGVTAVAGWVPFIFLAIVVLGFCTWEGGLFGIQEPNEQFRRFGDVLKQGKHVFFVDTHADQEATLERIVSNHPQLEMAGMGKAAPGWFVGAQNNWRKFTDTMP